ncbi:MAG: hypothetical protein ACP5GU_04060 [Thermoprotei archaeon]
MNKVDFSSKDLIIIVLSLIIIFNTIFLYHPVTNLGTITSNPSKPGSLIVTSNLNLIVESQFFALNLPTAKQVDISDSIGYVTIFSSQGIEISRSTLKPYNDKLRTTFSLQPDRYIIRIFLQLQPKLFFKLYNIQNSLGGNYFVQFSSDAFGIVKDINVLINSSSSITLRIIINISETSIYRVEIFNYYDNISINYYSMRLIYSYNSYGELYRNLLFLLNSRSVIVLSNADEKSAADGKSFVNVFTMNSNIIPLSFVYGVVRIAWFIEGGS